MTTGNDPFASVRHNVFTKRERAVIAAFLGLDPRKVEAVGFLAWQKAGEGNSGEA